MSGYIDLHIHSNCSDGILSPKELLEAVRERKLAAFSITDHDTIDGYHEAEALLRDGDPELVPGLELSVAMEGADMHLLAYLFDPDSETLNLATRNFKKERNQRGRLMVEKLNEQGLELSWEAVEKTAADSAMGRPHLAEVMVKAGLVGSIESAFRKHIGNHCPAYIPKSHIGPQEAIDLVHECGGVAVLAHPFLHDVVRSIEALVEMQLDGIEVYHYSHRKPQVKELKRLARRYGLLMSGGSDFHGRLEHEGEIGVGSVPIEHLELMKFRAEEIRGRN